MEAWIQAYLPSALNAKTLTSLIIHQYLYYFQNEEHKNSRENTEALGKENGTAIDIWDFGDAVSVLM
jgi:hypothetical protein